MGCEWVNWCSAHAPFCYGGQHTSTYPKAPPTLPSCDRGRLALYQPTQRVLKVQEVCYKSPLLPQDPT